MLPYFCNEIFKLLLCFVWFFCIFQFSWMLISWQITTNANLIYYVCAGIRCDHPKILDKIHTRLDCAIRGCRYYIIDSNRICLCVVDTVVCTYYRANDDNTRTDIGICTMRCFVCTSVKHISDIDKDMSKLGACNFYTISKK